MRSQKVTNKDLSGLGEKIRKPRIVIIGGGFGGIYVAEGLKKLARRGQAQIYLRLCFTK
jgi:cation diffusion facilitator CzcD-associated flavoprotein CzcO